MNFLRRFFKAIEDDTFIKLVFEVPGGDVRARALVCDSRLGQGMGIQFVAMGHETRARLNRLLSSLKTG